MDTILETQGLFGVSDESRRLIFNASARALNQPDAQVKEKAWKRMVSDQCPDVFEKVQVEGIDPLVPVVFYMASIKKMLQHVLLTCTAYASRLEQRLQSDPACSFQIIIYNDEATGGNILQPNSSKKAASGISAWLRLDFVGLMLLGTLSVSCNTGTLTEQMEASQQLQKRLYAKS